MAANQARKTEAGEKRMVERIPILWSANMKRYTDTKNGVVKGERARELRTIFGHANERKDACLHVINIQETKSSSWRQLVSAGINPFPA